MGTLRHLGRKLPSRAQAVALVAVIACALSACSSDETWFDYTPAPPAPVTDAALVAAAADYLAGVRAHLGALEETTALFADAFAAGDDAQARATYREARVLWEYVRPVSREFPDLYAALGARQSDLGPLELWTGWHRAEKALWPAPGDQALTDAERIEIADALVSDTAALIERMGSPDFAFTAVDMGEGATEAVGNLAVNHALGLAEVHSRADLWGVYGGVEGAQAAYATLRDAIAARDPDLVIEIDERFDTVWTELAQHGSVAEGFTPYDELTAESVRDLVRSLDALAQSLSMLAVVASSADSPSATP